MGKLTMKKAKKILEDGKAHGKKLTKRQKAFFSVVSEGQKPKRKINVKRS